MACSEKSQRRQSLLSKLKDLVDNIDDKSGCPAAASCCPPCCPPCVTCAQGPVIEIYDPLPKPCVPICSPCCAPKCDPCCTSPCCPAPCCAPQCDPCCTSPCCPAPCCPPPSKTYPVPLCCPPCCAPVVPPCMPICTPCPPPCVPICNPCPEPQPCVPCNPPQMMVCYRMPKSCVRRSKSRELRASILYSTCDCIKRNGLQDDCPRSECHGSPECLAQPEPCCGPAEAARMHQRGESSFSSRCKGLEEYQCYPAYVKLPGGPSPCSPPICPCPCGPCVPLVAAPPCPPPICPGPPPIMPIGNVMPVCQPCCPCPC